MNRRRVITLAGAAGGMLTASVLANSLKPDHYLSLGKVQLRDWIPLNFQNWQTDSSSQVVLPLPDIQARLDQIYSDVLARTYAHDSGARVMLSIAYGSNQSDATAVHRPEICYVSQGFEINHSVIGSVAVQNFSVPVRRLVASLGARIEPITYWMIVGNHAAATGFEAKLAQMRYGFRGIIPDGFLIRVSTIDSDISRAFSIQERFVIDLFGVLTEESAARLAGIAAKGRDLP